MKYHLDSSKCRRKNKTKCKKKTSKTKKKKKTIEKLNNLEKLKGKFYFSSKLELDKLRAKHASSKIATSSQPIM